MDSTFYPRIREEYLRIVDQTLIAYTEYVRKMISNATPIGQPPAYEELSTQQLRRSRLGRDLLLIAEYASEYFIDETRVEQAIEQVSRLLFGSFLLEDMRPPQQFYLTVLGTLFQAAFVRLHDEELMTPVQVYKDLGIARQSLYDRVTAGKLHPVFVRGEMRFLRSEVQDWKQQRAAKIRLKEEGMA